MTFRALLPLLALAAAATPTPAPLPPQARAQVAQVADAVARYRDFAVAQREGWKKFGDDEPLIGEHWYDPHGPDYQGADARLDWRRPSNLMYTAIDGRRVLTGVAYTVRIAPGEPVPEGFAGASDHWHVHDFEKAIAAALEDRPLLRWIAQGWLNANYRSGDDRGRVAMAHVWVTLPNPDGVFASHNRIIPYLKLGLPEAYADGASLAAAQGVNLATTGGCRALIDGRLWIAHASKQVGRDLHAACDTGAASVRAAIPAGPARLNAAGEAAWATFDAAWNHRLTSDQHRRLSTMGEHGEHEGHNMGGHDEGGHDMGGMHMEH